MNKNCKKSITNLSVENYISSSEDEEELDEKKILESIYKHYKPANDNPQLLAKTTNFLENVLQSGAATCLICIGNIRHAESIWSCKQCFCFFHLNCIKRWANDSIAQLKIKANQSQDNQGYYNHLGDFVPPKRVRTLQWFCPQCRGEYNPTDRPTTYYCFCEKEINPPLQTWLVPHSCGEICGKLLRPECGHKCLLLCHPGPCPPCAQYASISCLCGKSPPKSVRCMEKDWKCEKKCAELLSCGVHRCNQRCHKPGECPPCSSTSMQYCECRNEAKKRSCSDLQWHCSKICNSIYLCGIHSCRKVCHAGSCGDCPLSLPRSCPCGKNKKVGPCTEVVDACGDTCQKLLSCKVHTCTQRCHRGECNLCLIIVKKKCRCGLREREIPCSKEFTCDTKCKQLRDCGKHACNRKCCDGHCPPCDKICGKPLSCQKHKCNSVCHDGPCYPCERQSQVNCRCGKTTKNVPCGRERTVRILCLEPCRIPSKCHHPSKHRCHKNECPPCGKKCGLPNDTTGCGHICEAKCHSAVKILKKSNQDSPNLWKPNEKYEFKSMSHPQCEFKVSVTCIGGHETDMWPCWNSKPTSCQRKCNRLLRCGNHKCELVCHAVADIADMKEQIGCGQCHEGCKIARPPGCTHPCPRACHLPPCLPCQMNIKKKCHCGLTQVMYKCSEYYSMEGTEQEIIDRKERLESCGDCCLKNLPCGHRCASICHSGECPYPELCRRKVRIYCECKRVKTEVACDKYRAGFILLQCTQVCLESRSKIEQMQTQKLEEMKRQEEAKNRMEVEQFEKKFSKRKHNKERRILAEATKRKINWKLISIYTGTALAVFAAIAVAFYAEN